MSQNHNFHQHYPQCHYCCWHCHSQKCLWGWPLWQIPDPEIAFSMELHLTIQLEKIWKYQIFSKYTFGVVYIWIFIHRYLDIHKFQNSGNVTNESDGYVRSWLLQLTASSKAFLMIAITLSMGPLLWSLSVKFRETSSCFFAR